MQKKFVYFLDFLNLTHKLNPTDKDYIQYKYPIYYILYRITPSNNKKHQQSLFILNIILRNLIRN